MYQMACTCVWGWHTECVTCLDQARLHSLHAFGRLRRLSVEETLPTLLVIGGVRVLGWEGGRGGRRGREGREGVE